MNYYSSPTSLIQIKVILDVTNWIKLKPSGYSFVYSFVYSFEICLRVC